MYYSNADYSILPYTYLWFGIIRNFTMTKGQTLLKSKYYNLPKLTVWIILLSFKFISHMTSANL